MEYLYERLLKAEPQEVIVIREALLDHKADLTERLWTLLENPKNDQDQRFRAACALAAFAPDDPRWEKVSGDVAATLVDPETVCDCPMDGCLEGRGTMADPAAGRLSCGRETQRIGTRFDRQQSMALTPPTCPMRMPGWRSSWTRKVTADASVEAKVALAKKQASIGMALLVMGRGEKVWPLLKHSPDPTLRSFLIERLGPGGVDPKVLTARLEEEQEVSVKRAILLSLGEFGLDRLSQDRAMEPSAPVAATVQGRP